MFLQNSDNNVKEMCLHQVSEPLLLCFYIDILINMMNEISNYSVVNMECSSDVLEIEFSVISNLKRETPKYIYILDYF